MNALNNCLFLVVVQEKREGHIMPEKNHYFTDPKAAKMFANDNNRFFARHSWRKASIKAIPV